MPDIAKEKTKVTLAFSPTFIKSIDLLLTMYQNSLGLLDDIVKNPDKHINDMYGICNNGYKLRYVTPHDVSTFVSYLGKIVNESSFPIENVNDLEAIATSMIQQFVNDNEKCIPFENTTIFANGTHPTQRTMNLSMLMLICDNEFYDTNVYSKSDMINRAMALRYDVNLMDTLRFPLNMRKLITRIPSVLADYCGESLLEPSRQKVTMDILERFLITAATINVSAVKGMMAYCIPRVYYNNKCIKDDLRRKDYDYYPEYTVKYSDGIVTEAVDMSKNKPVFISFSNGKASVLGESYGSSEFKNSSVDVYCVFVPTNVRDSLVKGVYSESFVDSSVRGSSNRRNCVSFINTLLANRNVVDERNKEFRINHSNVLHVFEGNGYDYDPDKAINDIRNTAIQESDNAFDSNVSYVESFYTECCLLKTNTMRIRSKIPFNCNMRDIVLQDMHPEFKDTQSALMFMVTDPRSPITSLVRKYRTIDRMQPVYRAMNMFAHLRHAYGCDKRSEANLDNFRNKLGMHTDVNWLDKITYGNQFLDGNYRADALGNNKFNPMEETLSHLYAMYCCESLKSNEELANHIVEITNLMSGIIDSYVNKENGCVYNWEMVRDILAVLGEILTRTMLKLYNNNTTVISISDDIGDGEAPGYMYAESFEMFLEEAGPSIKVTSNKTGANKVLGNVRMVIRKFIDWVSKTFGNITGKFNDQHSSEIKWVTSHDQLNTEIGNALGQNGFKITLNNYKPYNLQIEMIKNFKLKEVVDKALKGDKDTNGNVIGTSALDITRAMMNNSLKNANEVLPSGNVDDYKTPIINYFLYGRADEPAVVTKDLDKGAWDDIVKNLKDITKAFQEATKTMGEDLKAAAKAIDSAAGNAEGTTKVNVESFNQIDLNSTLFQEMDPPIGGNDGNDGNDTTGSSDQATGDNKSKEQNGDDAKARAQALSQSISQISSNIYLGLINAMNNVFYKNSYKIYRDVVTAYKSQYEAPQTNAAQQATTATTGDQSTAANATGAGGAGG